jgi:hypothetical protein
VTSLREAIDAVFLTVCLENKNHAAYIAFWGSIVMISF